MAMASLIFCISSVIEWSPKQYMLQKLPKQKKRAELMYASTVKRANENKATLDMTLEEFISVNGDYTTKMLWTCQYGQLHETVPYSVGKCNKHKNSHDAYHRICATLEECECKPVTAYDAFMENGGCVKDEFDWLCMAGQPHTTSGQKAGTCVRHTHMVEQYHNYVTALEAEKWEMLSPISEYETIATTMAVMCDKGHKQKKSFDNFKHGHRCLPCTNNNKKNDKEDVKQAYIDSGYSAPSDAEFGDDWNGHKAVKVTCPCGKLTTLSYSNLVKGTKGCKCCGSRSRRTPWEIIVDAFEEEGNVLKTVETDYDNEETALKFACPRGHNAITTWKLYQGGRRCRECAPELRKETCREVYGVDNPFQSEEIKKKIVKTHMERRGVPHHMKDPKVIADRVKNRPTAIWYTFPSGREVACEGYEVWGLDWCLQYFAEDEIRVSSEVIDPIEYFFPNEKGKMVSHHYHCDIMSPKHDLYIEIKSREGAENPKEIERNNAKYQAVVEAGFDILVLTFNYRGKLVEEVYYGGDAE